MTMTRTTVATPRRINAVADLAPSAMAICQALGRGNAHEAQDQLARVQQFLLGRTARQLRASEDEVLAALMFLPGHRGARVASWLLVHSIDCDSREFWTRAEKILHPAMFGSCTES